MNPPIEIVQPTYFANSKDIAELPLLNAPFPDEFNHYQYLMVCKKVPIHHQNYELFPLLQRCLLYQAGYYQKIGMSAMAFDTYQQLVKSTISGQEVWLAYLELAKLGEKFAYSTQNEIAAYLLKAFDVQPLRAESLVKLACLYRVQKKYRLAYLFAKQALDLPKPPPFSLGIEYACYDWQARDEYAIACYWINDYKAAEISCRQLLASEFLPEDQRPRIEDNLKWALLGPAKNP